MWPDWIAVPAKQAVEKNSLHWARHDKPLKQDGSYKETTSAPAVNMLTRYFTEAVYKYA